MSSDPLLRALQGVDEACPDGKALGRLGALLREHAKPPQTEDLTASVLTALDLRTEPGIDAIYSGDCSPSGDCPSAADPAVERLADLVRSVAEPPQRADILPGVLHRLRRGSDRLRCEEQRSWRVWPLVVGGHLAALLALSILPLGQQDQADEEPLSASSAESRSYFSSPGNAFNPAFIRQDLPPIVWDDNSPSKDLFSLRRQPQLRNQALRRYGGDACSATVAACLRFLRQGQAADGCLVDLSSSPPSNLARHSLVFLAILGEGLNSPDDRTLAIDAVRWLLSQRDDSGRFAGSGPGADAAAGIALLALVECAVLLDDSDLRTQATLALRLAGPQNLTEAGGAGGFYLLALDVARATGIAIDDKRRQALLDQLLAKDNHPHSDLGRQGLIIFLQLIHGQGTECCPSLYQQLLSQTPQHDNTNRADPLNWIFPTLALREIGGQAWTDWNRELQRSLLSLIHYDNANAWMPADAIKHIPGGSERSATALSVLALQVPYRYLPLGLE